MKTTNTVLASIGAVLLLCGVMGGCMWGWPKYMIYKKTMRGHADFKEAEVNRQIRVEEARAEEEALMLEASGEAEREKIKADATAYAVQTVGEALETHQSYLKLHWINEIAGSQGERIYIPTEAGIPILEARNEPTE